MDFEDKVKLNNHLSIHIETNLEKPSDDSKSKKQEFQKSTCQEVEKRAVRCSVCYKIFASQERMKVRKIIMFSFLLV